jgi:hypothetical protein
MTLDELQRLCDKATPGPWNVNAEYGTTIWAQAKPAHDYDDNDDAHFITAARLYLPKLIAVARAAKAATEDWYFDDSYKDLCVALAALEQP